jgi:hypothetical protein
MRDGLANHWAEILESGVAQVNEGGGSWLRPEGSIDVKSPFHSLARKKAKKKRTLVLSPGFVNHQFSTLKYEQL